ncbi:MAG: amino acid ABC transporter permease [Desulfobacterales bacterium]|nr:amino acid ABC transporter permease [Desulfobacterales bacterium]
MTARRPSLGWLDALIAALLAAGAAYLVYRVRVGLNYQWEWGAIPQYLFRYDPAQGGWVPNVIMSGFFMTIRLSIWATLIATLIGVVMGLLRVSRSRFRRMAAAAYVELTRNTPPLVLIFIFYFFIGDQLLPTTGLEIIIREQSAELQALFATLLAPPGRLTVFISAVLTLSIFEGAYITEIVRAGIQSIEKGQREAAAALGFTRWQRMRHVILPQAVQRILPPLGGQFISTIKDSAIVAVISIPELTFRGMELMAATYLTFETWITITGLYFVLTFGCSLAIRRLELGLRHPHPLREPFY